MEAKVYNYNKNKIMEAFKFSLCLVSIPRKFFMGFINRLAPSIDDLDNQ